MNIARFWPQSKRRAAQAALGDTDDSFSLDAYETESSAAPSATRTIWMACAVAAVALTAVVGAYEYRKQGLPWTASTGSVTFDTVPGGLEVVVGQKSVGRSPVTIALAPGTYDVRLGSGTQARTVSVAVTAGTTIVQHFEMAASPAGARKGSLRVQTEPAARRRVAARQRTTVKPDAGGIVAGWLAVTSRVPLQIKENGHVVGSTDIDKLLLPSGEHDLELSNDALGFRLTRHVKIAPDQTAAFSVEVPDGTLSLNARPWAEVFVDGQHLGQTPIGNVTLPIGAHEVLFRHPDLGDRKATVNVGLLSPARLGVDLRKK